MDTAPVAVTSSRRFSSTLARVAGTAEHLRSISLSGKRSLCSCLRSFARPLVPRACHACLLHQRPSVQLGQRTTTRLQACQAVGPRGHAPQSTHPQQLAWAQTPAGIRTSTGSRHSS